MNTKSKSDDILDVVVLGAGFGGLHALYRLREEGLKVVALDAASDAGGAWFWNRYPGARCDIESLVYCYTFLPVLNEEWRWSERYAGRDEICRYLQWVADRLDLRKDIHFKSRLVEASFDKENCLWELTTENGHIYRARYFVSSAGPISEPIMPNIPGLSDFTGQLIHTARWPEEYPDFSEKRVGVIGTGSSGVQLIPIVAEQCKKLTVFIRTANFHAPARNRPLTQEDYQWWDENRELTLLRLQRCQRWGGGDIMLDDDINDAMFHKASEFTADQRRSIYEKRYENGGGVVGWAFCDAMIDKSVNDEAADFFREKIQAIVTDSETANKLTPRGFAYGTKRCTVGTNFLETFNRENVELIDVNSDPIERITEHGVIVGSKEIELDVLIAASGFDALTGALTKINIRGEDGQLLADTWKSGVQTHLGIAVHGFPNFFMIGGPGSPSVLTNVVMTNEMQVDWIVELIAFIYKNGFKYCSATPEAQEAWTREVNGLVEGTLWETSNSWYVGANVPGKTRQILAYVGGYAAYKESCLKIRDDSYRGFTFQ